MHYKNGQFTHTLVVVGVWDSLLAFPAVRIQTVQVICLYVGALQHT